MMDGVPQLTTDRRSRATYGSGAVLIHANDPQGNAVIAFRRGDDGVLSRYRAYRTGGLGAAQAGAPADPLASQRSMEYDDESGRLYVVNAGSDSLSVFDVDEHRLRELQVVPTDGPFPTSVTARDGLVYVLNAGGDGSITGFRSGPEGLVPLPGSTRSLDLAGKQPPYFLDSPGQVGFSGDGGHLVVTTKNHDTLLTFAVADDGSPAAAPVVTPSAGRIPFAFVVVADVVVVAEASGAVSSYRLQPDGRLLPVSASVGNGQQATCWIARARRYVYAVNAGSGTVSGYTLDTEGRLRLMNRGGVTAHVGPGAIDIAVTPDGSTLYVENGASATVHPFRVETDGSLLPLPETSGLPRYGGHSVEGIVAT
jgi:6-phosphogluconolactonase (cycloisomerase 2 family)